jgi:hypothetical protein
MAYANCRTIFIQCAGSPRIIPPLPSWDRMITGVREGGRPMAVLDRGIQVGRSPSAMSLLAFTRLQKRPMRQPGQKAVTGRVASPHPYRLVPSGRTTRPVRPLECNDSDRKRGVIMNEAVLLRPYRFEEASGDGPQDRSAAPARVVVRQRPCPAEAAAARGAG